MKTLLKILAVLIVIVIALLFILPIVYKSEIVRLTKNELNNNINAIVNFEDIDLSLISSFPNFNISIYGLSVVGKDVFAGDTLIKSKKISLAVDITSVISSDDYKIKSINIFSPVVKINILSNGTSNYDISLPDSNEDKSNVSSTNSNTSGFNFDIERFHIADGKIIYNDAKENIHLQLSGLHYTLSGKLGLDKAVLATKTRIANLSINYNHVQYLSNVALVYKASIDADMKNEIYKLGKNELIVNDMFINFDGTFSYIQDKLNLILSFKSKGNRFKEILSLVPAIYTNNFEQVKADGTFSIDGYIKGEYTDEHIPSFNINTTVDNAMFKYASLPNSVKNINLKVNISNMGGSIDNTVIDINKLEMMLGNNPLSANIKISTPLSDPNIDAKVIGDIGLSSIKDYYPVTDTTLSGSISFNVKFKGKLSSVENGESDDFVAMGSVLATDIIYNTNSFNNPINIVTAQLNFSPEYIDLVSFKAITGKNDINITGKINNYLPYYFNKGTLTGSLLSNSNFINIDELISTNQPHNETVTNNHDSNEAALSVATDTNSVIEIPDNINFTISSSFYKLIYDSLEMSNVKGRLVVADKTLTLQNLIMDAVDGKMTINGSYSTSNIDKPKVDFSLNMKNMSIPKAYNKFAIFRNYIPIAKKTTGLFSANFNINTILDKKLMPIYKTMNGAGNLSTSQIEINDLNSLAQIAKALNIVKFNKLEIDKINLSFAFINGKLEVKPSKFKYQNINADISGWTGLDKSIGYTLNLKIPRAEFGANANATLENIMGQVNNYGVNFSIPDIIPIKISIDGTLDNPKVHTSFNQSNDNTIVEEVKETINIAIEKEKEKLKDESSAKAKKIIEDADKQAQQLIADAKKQAKLIKENAEVAKKNLIQETDKQAENLITEGKKNGFVAEMAAKEAAKQLKAEIHNNAENIIIEANKKSDDIINEAKKAAKKLKADAKKEADKLSN